jgi:hypothetical protein
MWGIMSKIVSLGSKVLYNGEWWEVGAVTHDGADRYYMITLSFPEDMSDCVALLPADIVEALEVISDDP